MTPGIAQRKPTPPTFRWFVLRYDAQANCWRDVPNPQMQPDEPQTWDAADAGDAFRVAVLANDREPVQQTSYRVFAFDRSGTFNVSINVEAVDPA